MKEKTLAMESNFIEDVETQFNKWQEDLERLEEMVTGNGHKIKQVYADHISTLKRYLNDLDIQIAELKSAELDQWAAQKSNVQKARLTYYQSYGDTIELIKQAENKPAGWLEGFKDRPPARSAGWLEGTDTRPEGSEGWVEGMAE